MHPDRRGRGGALSGSGRRSSWSVRPLVDGLVQAHAEGEGDADGSRHVHIGLTASRRGDCALRRATAHRSVPFEIARYACQVPCPSTGNTTITTKRQVNRLNRKSPRTMAPQVSMTGRLFHTRAMLVPIAVRASTRSSSSIGIENALIANEKAANRAPTALPTTSIAQPVALVNSIGAMWSSPGNGQIGRAHV